MSIRAIQAVWDRTTAGGSLRLLLLALADFADEDGYSWPSRATLAERTGRTERQVRRLITIAIAAGELQADRAGGHTTSRYLITPGGAPIGGRTSTSPQGGRRRPPREDTRDRPGRTPTSPEPSESPQRSVTDPAHARELELQDAEERLRAIAAADDAEQRYAETGLSGDAARAVDARRAAGPTAAEIAAGGAADPVVRYHELTGRFPSERVREWVNDVAGTWGDERTADALTEAYRRDQTHRGLIGRAVDVMNEQEHEAERANRKAREIAGAPPRPEQTPEERERILEENRQRAREARGKLLADGLVAPTRAGDQELLAEELQRREGAAR
jgi:hypothetical protein